MIKRLIYRPEVVLGLFLLVVTYLFIWSEDTWRKDTLSSDGRGYYAYLPAVLIFQDLSYESNTEALDEQLDLHFSHHYILKDLEGNTFNKCFPGVAIVQLPLFLIATFLSFLFGLPINGYNDLYLISITLTGILSAVTGFHYLKKLLIALDFTVQISIISAMTIFVGTNVFFYALWGGSIGHIHSYAAIAAFLYYSKTFITKESIRSGAIACFLLSLIFIIRPTNILVVLLIPYLAGSFNQLKKALRHLFNKRNWIAPMLLGLIPILTLPAIWYAQTGHFVVWSYSDEGFYFTNPKMWSTLFSFRNGLFIYSPLALLALLSIYYVSTKSKFQGIFLSLYFLINVYVISSWWCFAYGGGFGHRVFVEHQVFFGILLAYGISYFPFRKLLLSTLCLLVTLSLLQTYQYTVGILPSGYCTAEIYFHTFLKFDPSYEGACSPRNDEYYYGATVKTTELTPEPKYFEFSEHEDFQMEATYSIKDIAEDHRIYLELDYSKMRLESSQFDEVFFVVDGTNEEGNTVFYTSFPLYEIRSEALNQWKEIHLGSQLPRENITSYKMYIWNKGRHTFKIKDIHYTIKHISAKDM
ncbi:MAG: hypothetical protein ACI9N1_001986 [Flavobacteriales bacterium]